MSLDPDTDAAKFAADKLAQAATSLVKKAEKVEQLADAFKTCGITGTAEKLGDLREQLESCAEQLKQAANDIQEQHTP